MERRKLRFDSIDEILPDVRRLEAGHRTVGQWSLARICRHLADTFDGSIDGFDLSVHRFKRRSLSRWMWRYTLRYGIPANYTVNANLTPPDDAALGDSILRLERAIERYRAHEGPLRPHPLFDRLSRDEWARMHCIHAAHHLSFAIPE